MSATHFISTGITITFSGFSAEILDVRPPAPRREAINVSHQGTTVAHVFEPATLVDWGECEIDCHLNPASKPPMTGVTATCTITFSDSAGTAWEFQAFVVGFRGQAALEGKGTGTLTLKVTGAVA
jgi:hypothetical protein